MTWLFVGGDSEIGRRTGERARATGITVAATTRQEHLKGPTRPLLDLSTDLDRWAPPPGTDAACIFAAVARLSDCESDPIGSALVNVEGTLALTERLLERDVYVLFLSTNQVFDGSYARTPADASLSPRSEYGRQKARTETALRQRMAAGAPTAILRLAKVVSPEAKLFHDWIGALTRGAAITAFADMKLAPTPVGLVAEAIIGLMRDRASGIFQLTGSRDVTYADLAREIARQIDASEALVEEASAATAGLSANALPPNTTLDSDALKLRYGMEVPDVAVVVEGVIDNWRANHPNS